MRKEQLFIEPELTGNESSLYGHGAATRMIITVKPHAEMRMKDRRITEAQVHEVLQDPKGVMPVRYGRFAAYGEIEEKRLLVIYEKKDRGIEVVTALWVDERRLRRLGFVGI